MGIELGFVRGGSLRRVFIKGRKISIMAQETGFTPLSIDLDKLNEKEIRKKMGKDGLEFIKEVAKLKTQGAMARDVTRDFQLDGWRRIKNESN